MSGTLRPTARQAGPRIGFAPTPLADVWATLLLWRRVARERRALATLDARLLRDIGIDAASAEIETARPFWDAPEGR